MAVGIWEVQATPVLAHEKYIQEPMPRELMCLIGQYLEECFDPDLITLLFDGETLVQNRNALTLLQHSGSVFSAVIIASHYHCYPIIQPVPVF